MPWKTSDAPEGLPEHAKEIWAKAATSALKAYGDEKKAIATAWSAVKKAGYAKGEDGKWHKVDMAESAKDLITRAISLSASQTGKRLLQAAADADEKDLREREQLKQTGKHWGPVLRHVAFLGAQAPAVKGLKDAVNLGQESFEKEIIRAGTWIDSSGRKMTVTEDDLDKMVANFHALKGIEDVPLLMAAVHDEEEFQRILAKEGPPSLGWVDDVKRVGTGVVASFNKAAKVAKDLIMEGRFPKCSVRFTPDYVFGETADNDCSISYEPSREEGEDMAEDRKFTEADVAAQVKVKVDAALAEAKTKSDTKLTEAEKEAKEAKDALLAEQAKQTKARVTGFAEALKARRVAPVVATDFTELAKGLDNAEQVEFAEGKRATVLERTIAFVESVLDLAEGKDEKSLFVPAGEAGTGEDFTAGDHDANEAKGDKALVKELAEMSDRVPDKK